MWWMNYKRPWWWQLVLFLVLAALYAANYHDDYYTPKKAISLSVKGDTAAAIEEFTKYLKKFPDDWSARFDRGQDYLRLNQIDSAIADFSEALRLRPDFGNCRDARARAYFAKMDYDKAIADYTVEIEETPSIYDTYYQRGVAYQRSGRFDAALADFEAYLSHNADNKYVVKARECARHKTNDGDCRALPDNSNPEQAEMVDKWARCEFQHKCD